MQNVDGACPQGHADELTSLYLQLYNIVPSSNVNAILSMGYLMPHQSDSTVITHHNDLGLMIWNPTMAFSITKRLEQALSHTALHDQHTH